MRLCFDEDLRLFLAPRNRGPSVEVPCDPTTTAGHLVQSLGVPLTEVGALVAGGRLVDRSYRPAGAEVVDVRPVSRPQQLPAGPPRFLLDVHLGTLTRRLRLLGLDCAYSNDADDDELVAQAGAETLRTQTGGT